MIELGARDVHVWHRFTSPPNGDGDADGDAYVETLSRLSPDERDRASRFVFARDRVSFAAAHRLLRETLSQYEDVDPVAWRFETRANGKPVIGGTHATCGLRFNISHTEGLVACAVSRGFDVGVDVERIRPGAPRTDLNELAARFFSAPEAEALAAGSEADRHARFIELWTLKEAYVKAVGEGLSHALDTFSFAVAPPVPIRFDAPPGVDRECWRFALCAPSPEYRMAAAAGGRPDAPAEITVRGDCQGSGPLVYCRG